MSDMTKVHRDRYVVAVGCESKYYHLGAMVAFSLIQFAYFKCKGLDICESEVNEEGHVLLELVIIGGCSKVPVDSLTPDCPT